MAWTQLDYIKKKEIMLYAYQVKMRGIKNAHGVAYNRPVRKSC